MHRVPGGRTGTVYGLASELESWLANGHRDPAELPAGFNENAETLPAKARAFADPRLVAGLAAVVALAVAFVIWLGRGTPDSAPPVSVAAVASPTASRETREFARGLNADLARFANASPDLAIFESEPGEAPQTQYAVRAEIETANGKMVAYARLTTVPRGQVIWSRRFEQSGPALSALREQVAANLIDLLRCSFGGLEDERLKLRPADIRQLMAICESFNLNDYSAAGARARQLTVSHPDLSLGWALLAMIQGEMVGQGNADLRILALANSRTAATIAPDGLNTWLAKVAASAGGPTSPDALPIIDDALRVHPDDPWLLYSRSMVLFNLGYIQSSVVDCLRALRNDPGSFEGRNRSVRRLAAAGRTVEAMQLQAEDERLWPGHPQVAANRALVAAYGPESRDADAATIRSFEHKFTATPYVAYNLAHLYERMGNRKAALDWLARAPVEHAIQQWSSLFWPDAAGLRAEPSFFRKMADLGLVQRWIARKKWPDFCAEPGLKYDCGEEARKLASTDRRATGR